MIKLLVIIIIGLIIVPLVGEESTISDLKEDNSISITDTTNIFTPKYMEVPILNNYLINQPIKEILRWNSIFMAQAVLFELLEAPGYGIQITGSVALLPGSSIGLLIGLGKNIIYEDQYNEDSPILFKKPYLQQEQKFTNYDHKWSISNKLIIKHNILFWDEIGLSYSLTGLLAENLHNTYEQKFQLSLADYYHYDRNIAFYYSISGGYSHGEYNNEYYKQLSKNSFCASGQIGLKVDLLDLLYFKLALVQDYSPFYYHLKEKGFWVTPKSNYGVGFMLGTTIF